MKVKALVTVLVILILINLGTIGSFFYSQYQHRREMRHPRWERFFGQRKGNFPPPYRLKPEQRLQLDRLRQEFNQRNLPKMKEIRRLRREVLALYQADSINLPQIKQTMRQISDLRLQMEIETIENMIKVKKYLTPQQQKFLYRMLEHTGSFGKKRHLKKNSRQRMDMPRKK